MKQTRYEWACRYAAVEPATDASVALQAPHVTAGTMSALLKMMSEALGPGDHAVLVMDQAGWHKARNLVVPANITILYLPPYSPELNPVGRLWGYLFSHYLSNQDYDGYDHLLKASAQAWQDLTPETFRSVCRCSCIPPELPR